MKKFLISLIIIFTAVFFTNIETFAVGKYGPNWQKPVIKVFIPQDNYSAMMKQAFQKWESKCNGRLIFEYIANSPADIEVEFVDKTDGSDGDIGSYSLTIQGGAITKAVVSIAPNPDQNSNDMIYTVMLHEIGHALGLKDTSRKLGIMSTPVTQSQDIINTDIIHLYQVNGWKFINQSIPVIYGD